MTSEEMRESAERIKAFGTQWTPEQLQELCECGKTREYHPLGILCPDKPVGDTICR